MKDERRTVKVSVVMTPTEHAALLQSSREQGRSKSQIVCRLIVADAKQRGEWPPKGEGDG